MAWVHVLAWMDLICEPRWETEVQELSTTVPETGSQFFYKRNHFLEIIETPAGRKDHPFQLVEFYIGEVLY